MIITSNTITCKKRINKMKQNIAIFEIKMRIAKAWER